MYRYMIDGREMTVQDIADTIGVSRETLYRYKNKHRLPYGAILFGWQNGSIRFDNPRGGKTCEIHMVDGKWMTTRDAAQLLGVNASTIRNYIWLHKCSLAKAIQYYQDVKSGRRKRHRGMPPKRYKVGGRWLTEEEAAKIYGLNQNTLRACRNKHKITLAAAISRIERTRQRRAEKTILNILKEGQL